jgi:proline iminopeptidase
MLDVGDGNLVYWEVRGSPTGKPAVVVHGGPGSSLEGATGRSFDPTLYRIVLFDQRGCGRSTPHASDPTTDMSVNTTEHLLADMELLRTQLGIQQWLLYGGSWGSTLILAYAERHPERVSEVVIEGVTTCRRSEIDWLYGGVGRFFPEEYARFRSAAAANPEDNVLAAYARLIEDPDPDTRSEAAASWLAWEDTVVSQEPHGTPNVYSDRPPAAQLALVRICAHYYANYVWLEDGALLRDADRLAGISAVLVHGRLDLSAPLETAWRLARAWPNAELKVIADSGHTGTEAMRAEIRHTLDRFAYS